MISVGNTILTVSVNYPLTIFLGRDRGQMSKERYEEFMSVNNLPVYPDPNADPKTLCVHCGKTSSEHTETLHYCNLGHDEFRRFRRFTPDAEDIQGTFEWPPYDVSDFVVPLGARAGLTSESVWVTVGKWTQFTNIISPEPADKETIQKYINLMVIQCVAAGAGKDVSKMTPVWEIVGKYKACH